MCTTCTTVFDAAATNSVLALAAASTLWERAADRWRGRSRLDRRQLTWEANADFVRSLGLDPLETLGASPTVPIGTPAGAVEPSSPAELTAARR